MEKVLISTCLLGEIVRYNAQQIQFENPILKQWGREGRLVPVCPEVEGGLPVPRSPAEIQGGDGSSVLAGESFLWTTEGQDVTENYLNGARQALQLAQQFLIKIAILKEDSPACGSHFIYDGNFSGTRKPGKGVAVALLEDHEIRVFSEDQLFEAAEYLSRLENKIARSY